jgi:hypothetical protein
VDCPAGIAQPGVRRALENASKRPDRLLTVFTEQDLEATARMRDCFPDIPPSEPSFALFKDGELVYFVARQRIEGRDAEAVASEVHHSTRSVNWRLTATGSMNPAAAAMTSRQRPARSRTRAARGNAAPSVPATPPARHLLTSKAS